MLPEPCRRRWTRPPAPRSLGGGSVSPHRPPKWVYSDGEPGHRSPPRGPRPIRRGCPCAPTGKWTANGLGEATITATWDGWFLRADFPCSHRRSRVGDRALGRLHHRWTPGSGSAWGSLFRCKGWRQGEAGPGHPRDGLHRDGLLLRDPLRLDQGVTVEMEFRMSLNGREGQRFQLCLQDIPLADRTAQRVDYERLPINGYTCLMHPEPRDGGESISLSAGFATQRLHLPQYLPSDDWIHVALQVRGDGEVTLVVNREPVARAAVHLSRASDAQWRVTLFGAGYGSELLVRQLRVWQGARY